MFVDTARDRVISGKVDERVEQVATHEDEKEEYTVTISTFLSSPDVAHTSVLAAQGSCEAVRSCGAVLNRRGKLLKQLEILRSSVACRTQLGTV